MIRICREKEELLNILLEQGSKNDCAYGITRIQDAPGTYLAPGVWCIADIQPKEVKVYVRSIADPDKYLIETWCADATFEMIQLG